VVVVVEVEGDRGVERGLVVVGWVVVGEEEEEEEQEEEDKGGADPGPMSFELFPSFMI
tara:strand:- start:153 stop:326 length:174 start_codon:yes stop_codon:yes gene_type:complete